jgi:hypothetical protein
MSDIDVYSIIEAAAQTLLRTVDTFTDASIVRGDLRVLESGKPPYIFLTPGPAPETLWGPRIKNVYFHTDIIIAAIHHHNGDEVTNIRNYRYLVQNLFRKYPWLNDTTDIDNGYQIVLAQYELRDRPYSYPPPDEERGIESTWLLQEGVLVTDTLVLVEGGDYG